MSDLPEPAIRPKPAPVDNGARSYLVFRRDEGLGGETWIPVGPVKADSPDHAIKTIARRDDVTEGEFAVVPERNWTRRPIRKRVEPVWEFAD